MLLRPWGWSAPAFKPNIYFGGGIYGTSGMGVNYLQPSTPLGTIQAYSSLNFMQVAPAVAYKIGDTLSVGMALDGAAEQVSFNQTFGGQGFNLSSPSWAYGMGATVGFLYKYSRKVTVSGSYKSEMLFTQLHWNETQEFVPTGVQMTPQGLQPVGVQGGPGTYSAPQLPPADRLRRCPPSSAQIHDQHGRTMDQLAQDYERIQRAWPWTGTPFVALPLHWQNEWIGNLGAQYDSSKTMQWRGGFVYGGNPIKSADMQANLIMPAIVTTGVTFGVTQKLPMRWSLTEALMHTFQNSVTDGTLFNLPLQPVKSSMSENSIGFQIGYFF